MKLIINKDRSVIPLGTWGTENENNYEVLYFEFPQELENYNKRIVYYLDDDKKWDVIQNNRIAITNAVTKYEKVKAYVWCTMSETITLHYVCDGTETGNYYFTYNNENHYFTMPEVQENDELIYDVATNTLKLGNTVIETTSTGTGNILAFSTIIDAAEDFRTKLFEMQFYENENADGIIPTQEEVDGFNTMLTAMNNEIAEMNQLEENVEQAEIERNANVQQAINSMNEAMQGVENLNIDVSDKVNGDVTVTLTKKDASTKTVVLSDGTSLMFQWNGTSLGVKTEDDEEYTYVDLQGVQGPVGPQGEAFQIKKTYSSVAEMNADFNNMQLGDYVMIASTVEVEDNAKLYTRGELQWIFISDFSGAQGIKGETGATPNIQIGTVVSGQTPSVTRSGTNENPVLNFVLEKGEQGIQGPIGLTGNGIASISKTGTSGLVDTYTITYTNGNTTTFTVTNGRGISSIAKTNTEGLIDTYTITYNDGTTSTFTITNGEDGEVTQEQLDETVAELQEEIDELSENMPWAETEQATEIDVTDAAKYSRNKLKIFGNTEQQTYSGKNLLKPAISKTENGITFDVQEDGTIIVNGTATANTTINLGNSGGSNPTVALPAGTYTLSGCPEGGSATTYRLTTNLSGGNTYDYGTGASTTISSDVTSKAVWFTVYSGVTVNNLVVKPMLEEGSTATDYEPYVGGQASPNPDFPQDIHVVTGNNTIVVAGRNLFDGTAAYTNQPLQAGGNVLGTSAVSNVSQFISVEENTQYTLSLTNDSNTRRIGFYYEPLTTEVANDSNFISTVDYSGNSKTFTTPAGCKYLRFSYYNAANNVQLEEGSTATSYEPYYHQEYLINLGSMELCKIGEYQDIIFKNTVYSEYYDSSLVANGWYKRQVVYKHPFESGHKIFNRTGTGDGINFYLGSTNFTPTPKHNKGYMKGYQYDNRSSGFANMSNYYFGFENTGTLHIKNLNYASYTGGTEFTNSLINANEVLYYVSDEVTNTQITDITLIAQLEAICNHLKLIKGINHITVTASDLEPYMKLNYIQDLPSKLSNIESRISDLETT